MLKSTQFLSRTMGAILAVGLLTAPAWSKVPRSDFNSLWERTKPDLRVNTEGIGGERQPDKPAKAKRGSQPGVTPDTADEPKPRRLRGSSLSPGIVKGADAAESQQAVCRSQCGLERQNCDSGRQGRDAFQNRSDQITAFQSSCYLAVSSCLARC